MKEHSINESELSDLDEQEVKEENISTLSVKELQLKAK
jgi:hypothetical protein